MTAWRDVKGEMEAMSLNPQVADRLLDGVLPPEDAPPGYGEVAALLRALAAPPPQLEVMSAHDSARLAAMMAAMGKIAAAAPGLDKGFAFDKGGPRGRVLRFGGRSDKGFGFDKGRPQPGFLRLKVAAGVLVGFLLGSSGLAMAGALPGGAQNLVSAVLGRVGISAPRHDDRAGGAPSPHPSASPSQGPDVTGPAAFGLCTAYEAGQGGTNGGKDQSVAFQDLETAAQAAGQTVEDYCAPILAAGPGGSSNGQGNQGDHGTSGQDHGQSGETHGHSGSDHPDGSDHASGNDHSGGQGG
jgi:hypothetical protein